MKRIGIQILSCIVFFVIIVEMYNTLPWSMRENNNPIEYEVFAQDRGFCAIADNQDVGWPMRYHDPQCTGFILSDGPGMNTTIWRKTNSYTSSSPIIADGKLYISRANLALYVYNANNGTRIKSIIFPSRSAVAVAEGRLFVAATDEALHCYTTTNYSELWAIGLGGFESVNASPYSPIAVDGHVYQVFQNETTGVTNIAGFDAATGVHLWNDISLNAQLKSDIVVNEGKIYATIEKKLFCFDTSTSNKLWEKTVITGSDLFVAYVPAIANSRLYSVSNQGVVYCLDLNNMGSLLWSYPTGDNATWDSNHLAVGYGNVYVGMRNGLYCVNLTTHLPVWTYPSNNKGVHHPLVAGTGRKVYMTIYTVGLQCLDAIGNGNGTTTVLWKSSYQPASFLVPALAQGILFFVDINNISAFHENTPPTPPTVQGPVASPVDKEFTLTIAAEDPENDQVTYKVQFSGGGYSSSFTYGPYPSGEPVQVTQSWSHPGTLSVQVEAKDQHDAGSGITYYLQIFTNTPPNTPDAPKGVTSGFIEKDYTYSSSPVTDPDEDVVEYQFDFDASGTHSYSEWLPSPQATHLWSTPGDYMVKVRAQDVYQATSNWSLPLAVTISSLLLKQLSISTTPSTIHESEEFFVSITENNLPIEGAVVTFLDHTVVTNPQGTATFQAPQVNQNTFYPITARKEGYQSASTSVLVINTEGETTPNGWIYGIVFDKTTQTFMQAAQICYTTSSPEGTVSRCLMTDTQGRYMVETFPGTYSVTVSKPGYQSQTKTGVSVVGNVAVEVSFTLEKNQNFQTSGTLDTNTAIVENTIQDYIRKGLLGARIDIAKVKDKVSKDVSFYTETLNIELNATNAVVQFTITAENGTNGTILVVRIGEGVLSDLDYLNVTYDGNPIPEWNDVAAFFNIESNNDPSWLRVLTTTGLYVFVRVPHFSSHTITISSMGQMLSGMLLLGAYLVVVLVLAVLTGIPVIWLWRKTE